MNRRQFLQASTSVVLAAEAAALADTPIPRGPLGKTGLQVTRITLGGAHMRFGTEENALRIIRRALDLGINFFDSAAKYNDGESDACYGKAIAGSVRQKVFLMSKAQLRTRDEAMEAVRRHAARDEDRLPGFVAMPRSGDAGGGGQDPGAGRFAGSIRASEEAGQGTAHRVHGTCRPRGTPAAAGELRRLGDGAASGQPGGSALPELHRERAAEGPRQGARPARDEMQCDGRGSGRTRSPRTRSACASRSARISIRWYRALPR